MIRIGRSSNCSNRLIIFVLYTVKTIGFLHFLLINKRFYLDCVWFLMKEKKI